MSPSPGSITRTHLALDKDTPIPRPVSFTIAGQPPLPRGAFLTADYANVTPDYLNILGARVVRGRGMTDADAARPNSGPGVVLVDQAFADKYLSFADPLEAPLAAGHG